MLNFLIIKLIQVNLILAVSGVPVIPHLIESVVNFFKSTTVVSEKFAI